jgi:fatty acid desaturase
MTDLRSLRRTLHRDHRDTVRRLHRLNPLYNLKIGLFGLLWVAGAGLATASVAAPQAWLVWPVVWALCTTGLYGAAILMHDGAHMLLARHREANAWLSFLCGAGVLISAEAYRVGHHQHHAATGTDADLGDAVAHVHRTGWSLAALVRLFLGVGTPLVVVGVAIGGWRKANAPQRARIALEYALIGIGFAAFLSLAPGPVVVHAWVVPFLIGGFVNNVRSLAEHTYTDREDDLRHSRTVLPARWVAWVQSHVNLHWEHHLFPQVPWYHLPELHRLTRPHREAIGVPTETSYLTWLVRVVWPRVRPGARP